MFTFTPNAAEYRAQSSSFAALLTEAPKFRATITCTCGLRSTCDVRDQKSAELLVERHVRQFIARRAYRHNANVETLEAI